MRGAGTVGAGTGVETGAGAGAAITTIGACSGGAPAGAHGGMDAAAVDRADSAESDRMRRGRRRGRKHLLGRRKST